MADTKNPDPFPHLPRRSMFADTAPVAKPAKAAAPPAPKPIAEVKRAVAAIEQRPTKRGRPAKGGEAVTVSAQKPWEAAGISRKTWYKRQKKQGDK